jgi:hypothetical protein
MNISRRLTSVRIVTLIVTVILVLFLDSGVIAGQEANQDVLNDTWSTALGRRAVPLEISQRQENIRFKFVKFFKLDVSRIVLTMRAESPEKDFLYVLGDLCDLGSRVLVSDAVILPAKETVGDFARNNLRYVVFKKENIDFAKCMLPGMRMAQVAAYEDRAIWESNRRVAFFLNRWAEFFGTYEKQIARATAFLNVSLPFQAAEIRNLSNSGKTTELEYVVTFFDHSQPLAILYLGEPLIGLDKAILKEYLETLVDARGKLIANHPKHQQKLLEEKEFLKIISTR